ncbi:MAG: amidohydrolase family protein [Acidobacteria bacterium]|nr:amidohydrolase family protein [Acidobacteriota bacterium]
MKLKLGLTFLLAVIPTLGLAQTADIILYNGKVITVDPNFTIAEAVAVRGDKIQAVGKSNELLRFADAATVKIDLKGKTVIPGVIESHAHFHSYGRNHYRQQLGDKLPEYRIDWALVKTKADFLAQIDQHMKRNKFKPGEMIFFPASNYASEAAIRVFYEELTSKDLDTVTPNNPIVISIGGGLRIFDGVCMVNSKMIDFLWAKYGDFINRYGRYWKDSSGKPTGILEPPISLLIEHQLLPRSRAEDIAGMLKNELQEWSAMGVTTVSTRMGSQDVEALKILDLNNELKVRIPYGLSDFFAVDDAAATFKRMGNLIGLGSSKLWINSFTPIIVDASDSRMATDQKRLVEYGPDGQYFPIGIALLDPEYRGARGNYFKEWFLEVARNGGRVANLHTAGDRSNRRMIEILEEINQEVPLKDKRWALDHCMMVNPDHLDRAAKLGIYYSCGGAMFINDSPEIARIYGDKVANTFVVPVKSMLNKGLKVVYQTDRHAYLWGDLEPMITRIVEGKVWAPQERIDKVTALKMITIWPAEYVLREKEIGSLERGKKADIAVLDRDYLTIPDEDVSEVQALMTICDGEIVHLHPKFSEEYNLKPPGATIATFAELFSRR